MTGSVQGDPCSDECPALLTGWTGLSVQVSGRCSGGQVHHKQKCSQTHVPTDKHHAFTSSHTCPQINTTPSHPHNPDCYRGEARGGSGLGLDLCFLIFYHECE